MTKYAFYVRVSTKDKQDYKRQIEDLHAIARNQGIKKKDIDIYQEKLSGYDNSRPQLQELIDKITTDNNYYSCIYITEISRLGRSPRKIREILWTLEDFKVNLFIQKGSINLLEKDGNLNSMGKLVLDIMINLADEEVRTLKERSKSGILSSIKAGHVGGGKFKPYGFTKGKNKMLVIDEEEAEHVRLIFELYKTGNGTKAIANILNNNDKIKTRSHKSFGEKPMNKHTGKLGNEVQWSDKTVDDILKNPIYKGKRRYWGGKENKKNKKPPILIDVNLPKTIVDVQLWDDCMELRKTKSHRNYLTEYTYLLKDKLVCGICGRNYFAKYKPTPRGDKVYICSSRLKKNGNCGNIGVNISLLESAIFNEIVESDSILKHINNKDEIKSRLESELVTLQEVITSTERQLIELDSNLNGALINHARAQGEGLSNRTDRLEKIIVDFENQLNNATKKLSKAKRNLVLTNEALLKRSDLETTSEILISYKSDRIKLRLVYLQIIDKIIVNVIDNKTVMANAFISIDGIVLPMSLKLFLDISGMRKKEKIYSYLPLVDWNLDLKYDNTNILLTPLDEIKKELYIIEGNAGMIDAEFVSIPNENILQIPLQTKP
ncbi:recombinase family protein [Yeosuana marina]|uniref:recombinase family protein n=1 Tax=Yeosuana marina TaxID=1565536 RepID=UPI0030EDB41D|tara:strand:- start:428 stop:2245 length:1818 start_codon:yes stop_codon:yes gene_type:complete